MRDIKFKCYILDNQGKVECTFHEWLDGDGWKHDYYSPLVTNGVFSYEDLGGGFIGEIIRKQYTGLRDRNGKEIYEGDIVKSESNKNGAVDFKSGCFMWRNEFLADDPECSNKMTWGEVIGNIYENPELLK